MSQEQPQNPPQEKWKPEPIKYGDVFQVSGDVAANPIAPQDAAMMQAAEARVLGQVLTDGPSSAMQVAAAVNVQSGLVGRADVSDVAAGQGVTVALTDVPGARIATEYVGKQAVGQYVQVVEPVVARRDEEIDISKITIGEAIEASAQVAGDKPVDMSDAAAIQAAEVRAGGSNVVIPGGVAATAQSAALYNTQVDRHEDKIKLRDVVEGAAEKLPADKLVTREDVDGIMAAEMRNQPELGPRPGLGGISASMAAAARLNKSNDDDDGGDTPNIEDDEDNIIIDGDGDRI